MLKGKVSMQELNMIANTGVPIYDELARSMGISVEEMMKLSSSGKITSADLTNVFQTMTSEGGIFYKGMEVSSTTFSSTLLGIKENIGIVAGEIGMKLLPVAKEIAGRIYDVTRNLIEWISTGDNFKRTVDIMIYTLAGLTAGLTAFLVVTKGAALIHGLAFAFKALTAAMAANPIGIIAVLITAVLIPSLIALYRNWDTVQTYMNQGIARLEYAFKWLGSQIVEKFVIAFNTVKIAAFGFVDVISSNVLGAVAKLLEVLGELPFVGEMFDTAAAKVRNFSNAYHQSTETIQEESRQRIEEAKKERDAIGEALSAKLSGIDEESRARRAALEEQKKQNEELIESEIEKSKSIANINKEEIKSLIERLNDIPLTEQQIQNQRIEQFQSFLQQRMDLQKADDEKRIAWLEEQQALLMEMETLNGEEKIALQKAVNEQIKDEEEKLKKAQQKIMSEKLTASSKFFGGISELASLASKESIGLLIIEKAAAAAEAAINSYLAYTVALASGSPPFNYIAAAGVLASGLAQQIKIISTAIPSAETGGRFIVPRSVGSDGTLMKVNSDERVNITPRGMTGFNETQHITVQLEKQTLFDVMNDGIRSGDILISAANF
jgi:hypothetical protein